MEEYVAYKVADRLLIMDLQNHLIDNDMTLSKELGVSFNLQSLGDAAKLELNHTPLYRLVLRSSIHHMSGPYDPRQIKKELEKLKKFPQALVDIIECKQEWQQSPWDKLWKDNWCDYHLHINEKRCSSGQQDLDDFWSC